MTLTLQRALYRSDGIFGMLLQEGESVAETLEHSFNRIPVLPPGDYTCVRGTHALSNLKPFQTFEVTQVVGHSGILFHCGNYNADSHGCILLGDFLVETTEGDSISGSRNAFDRFMHLLDGHDSFTLKVLP